MGDVSIHSAIGLNQVVYYGCFQEFVYLRTLTFLRSSDNKLVVYDFSMKDFRGSVFQHLLQNLRPNGLLKSLSSVDDQLSSTRL